MNLEKNFLIAFLRKQLQVLLTTTLETGAKWIIQEAVDQVICTISFSNDDPAYHSILEWLSKQPKIQNGKRVQARTLGYRGASLSVPLFTIGYGTHFIFYKKIPIWVFHYKEDPGVRDILELKVISPSNKFILSLLDEIYEEINFTSDSHIVRIYVSNIDYWSNSGIQENRPLNSVFLPEGELNKLVADIKLFQTNKERYKAISVPFRRGYLFYGVPGSGKTSTITAIASELHMNLYILNMGRDDMDDSTLTDLMSTVPPDSIIVIEDIDVIWKERTTDKSKVTFSTLLNVIDGIGASTNRLLFLTTNHLDTLDPALIRPGRVDYRLKFDYADDYQIKSILHHFYTPTDQQVQAFIDHYHKSKIQVSMADIQRHLLVHWDSIDNAIKYLDEFLLDIVSFREDMQW